jgi:hypothetical protein
VNVKRIAVIGTTAVTWVLLARTAVAQDGSDLGAPKGPEVLGGGGSAGAAGDIAAESAFTGTQVLGLFVLACVLFIVGSTVVTLARARTAVDTDA